METKLLAFIESSATIADVRGIDPLNPVLIYLDQPITSSRFTTVSAIAEPSHMGVPINATWVVLDPNNLYYKQALKLKSSVGPYASGVANVLADGGFLQSWVLVTSYDQIFLDPQYYDSGVNSVGPIGPTGPRGPVGPTGPMGPEAVVDYDLIIEEVLQRMDSLGDTPVLSMTAPAFLYEGSSEQLLVTATYPNGAIMDVTAQCSWATDTNESAVSSSGVFSAPQVHGSQINFPVIVTASYIVGSNVHTVSATILVRNIMFTGLVITGPAQIEEGQDGQFSVVAQFSNGTTHPVTQANWSITEGTSVGSISNEGMLTANQVGANTTVGVSVQFSIEGVTHSATKSVLVTNVATVIYPYYGVAEFDAVKDAALILNLTGRGSVEDLTASFTLDAGPAGSTTAMFFAYPVSYGLAVFEDQDAKGFFGGWDGAKGDPTDMSKLGPMVVDVQLNGDLIPFYLYQTDWPGIGEVTWEVTH